MSMQRVICVIFHFMKRHFDSVLASDWHWIESSAILHIHFLDTLVIDIHKVPNHMLTSVIEIASEVKVAGGVKIDHS